MVQRINLDTNILVDAILGKERIKSDAHHILHKIMSLPLDVSIPQIIIGESFTIVMAKSERKEGIKIFSSYQNGLRD